MDKFQFALSFSCKFDFRASTLIAKSQFYVEDRMANRLVAKLPHGDWFFLSLLGSNLDPMIFGRLVEQLDKLLSSHSANNGNVSLEKVEKVA